MRGLRAAGGVARLEHRQVVARSLDYSSKNASDTPPAPLGKVSLTANSQDLLGSLKDGKGQTSTYTYDGDTRLTGTSYADASGQGYSYDQDGSLLSLADGVTASSPTTNYTYDALGDVLQKTLPTNQTVSYPENVSFKQPVRA